MSRIFSKGITLSYKTGSASTYKELAELANMPDLGGAPDMIDTSNLKLGFKREEKGLVSYGSLEFEFWAEEGTTGNYAICIGLEDADEVVDFQLVFGGITYKFSGKVYTIMNGAAPNGYMKFKLGITLETEIQKTVA